MTIVLATCAIALAPLESRAQSESASIGWIGLVTTPIGAFTPLAPAYTAAPSRTSVGVQARYSHWQFDADDDNTTNFGGGLVIRRGAVRAAIEAGGWSKKDCSGCGGAMGGIDVDVGLLERALGGPVTFGLALNPAVGLGRQSSSSDDGFTSLVGAVSVPLSLSIRAGAGLRVTPFVSPGFSATRLTAGGASSTGSRAMLAGGIAVGGVSMPVQLTASARRVSMEHAPTIFGLGLAIGR